MAEDRGSGSPPSPPWHGLAAEEALARLEVDPERGLDDAEVARRRARWGRNRLPEPPRPHPLLRLVAQFADPLVGALLVAAAVAAIVAMTDEGGGSWADATAILLIVVLNALLGFFQERRAEQALAALRSLAAPRAKLLRGGEVRDADASELVPGDVIVLEAGDSVPADARLLRADEVSVEEAALTGESVPVDKSASAVFDEATSVADRGNVVFTGTTITRGHARALVVETGARTELGRIGTMLGEVERQATPLEKRLARLGRVILVACVAISAIVFAIGFVRETHPIATLLLVAVSLAVAAIPEGLPAITTITLALGMQRMAKRGAIVRKLTAVETLGSATVICSDKTGTLTQNQMTVRLLETVEERYEVSGEGFGRAGRISRLSRDGAELEELPEALRQLVEVGLVVNEAHLEEIEGHTSVVGDPTDGALLALSAKAGITREGALGARALERRLPFDGDRKRSSVVLVGPGGAREAWVKGSPDVLLPLCDRVQTGGGVEALTDEERGRWLDRNAELAGQALRVLALARRDDPGDDPEAGLVFLGLAAMIDPPRPEAKSAVGECHAAGIRVVMITGDHALTGVAIAKELGIFRPGDEALTGAELEVLSEEQLAEVVDTVTVYARVTAAQKLKIVRALARRGHVVAMTGDGVNDAPALKEASIGVAMGRSGTDVARQAAEMVLADDDFATIVAAVRQGRSIFRNIQKFIYFLGSSNTGLVFAVIVASFVDWMPQLLPLHLLWINLVTNGLPALALGIDPPEASQMRDGPRPPAQGIVGRRDLLGTIVVGGVMSAAALVAFWLPDHWPALFVAQDTQTRLLEARTMAFTVLALSPLFHAHNCRSPVASIFGVGLFTNPFLWAAVAASAAIHLVAVLVPALRPVFRTEALSALQWAVVLGLSALPIPVVELLKAADRGLGITARGARSAGRGSPTP